MKVLKASLVPFKTICNAEPTRGQWVTRDANGFRRAPKAVHLNRSEGSHNTLAWVKRTSQDFTEVKHVKPNRKLHRDTQNAFQEITSHLGFAESNQAVLGIQRIFQSSKFI
jgi:hypothetical protein